MPYDRWEAQGLRRRESQECRLRWKQCRDTRAPWLPTKHAAILLRATASQTGQLNPGSRKSRCQTLADPETLPCPKSRAYWLAVPSLDGSGLRLRKESWDRDPLVGKVRRREEACPAPCIAARSCQQNQYGGASHPRRGLKS